MAVLVTGGAGYIGSAFVEQLVAAGERVLVLDDLSRGHRAAVHPDAGFYEGRTGDRELVARIAREHPLDACVHFAAFAYVGESVSEPGRYFDNNFTQAQVLFETLIGAGVRRVVFSSTCATYGVPTAVPIAESHPQWPINPYGWSKLFVERLLEASTGPRPALRRAAIFQRCRRHGALRRAPRARDAPHPARAPRGGRERSDAQGLRPRLRHSRRHGDPRLRPRQRPGRGAPASARPAAPRG
jgi:dTDP-4-dehydrorhamnose reductase